MGSLTDAGPHFFFLFSSLLVSYPARVRRPDKNKNSNSNRINKECTCQVVLRSIDEVQNKITNDITVATAHSKEIEEISDALVVHVVAFVCNDSKQQ